MMKAMDSVKRKDNIFIPHAKGEQKSVQGLEEASYGLSDFTINIEHDTTQNCLVMDAYFKC